MGEARFYSMIKIFADTGDIEEIKKLNQNPLVAGFTTNPTIMYKAGITDYERFCREVLDITDKPVSFEVFADDFDEMERQARIISSWGENVYVKIPITNTKGESSIELINKLLLANIKLNITAVFTLEQVREIVVKALITDKKKVIVSVFGGRIADTGVDPTIYIKRIRSILPRWVELLWASPREVLNIYQADWAGCNIITCTPDLIEKYEKLKGKDLTEYSLETVRMFFRDGKEAGFKI